jgi:hypothetical protein
MSSQQTPSALQRALELSRELAAVAESGDVDLAVRLDAERLQELKAARRALGQIDAGDRAILTEIGVLNDQAIGSLQHRQRAKARDMDMASVGRRAVRAYSATRLRF